MKELLRAYWILIRRRTPGAYIFTPLVGLLTASKGFPPLLTAMITILSMIAAALSVYLYNDIEDLESDKLNPSAWDRPLVTGEVSKREQGSLAVISAGIGLALGFFVNFRVFLLIFTFLGLGLLYSAPRVHLKNRFLLKYATLGTGGAISSLVGGAAVDNLSGPVLYVSTLFFILTFGIYPIIDLRDIKGDERIGKKTFPMVFGPEVSIRLALTTVCAVAIASVVGYAQIGFNIAFPILAGVIFSAWIYTLYPVLKNWHNPAYIDKLVKKRMYPIFLILQICVIVGAL